MRAYTACLFDLYGTLVDIHTDESKPSFWEKAAAWYTASGAAWSGPDLRREYLRLCEEAEAKLLADAPSGAHVEPDLTKVFAALYRLRGIAPDPALLDETALYFRRTSTTHLRAYAGAQELLCELRARGKLVILLSNAQSCFTRPELDALGLTDCFDRIFISSEVGRKKPDPAFYWAALEALGLRPEDCLMIGNDPVCDVAGALAAGLDAVYIHSALSPKTSILPKEEPNGGDSRQSNRRQPHLILSMPGMNLKRLRHLLTL